MPASEPPISWPQPLIEIAGFIAAFLSAGAVGFRYAALGRANATSDDERRVLGGAARGAAALGLLGALIAAVLLATRLPGFAARRHLTVIELMAKDPPTAAQVGFMVVALLGFALALGRRIVGWPLATFGVITAWRHLHGLSNLWLTPYGITLIVKLCVVAAVVAFGAWNWRRQRPRLGDEAGTLALRGTARAELALAAVVLAVTSILVSLPSPR